MGEDASLDDFLGSDDAEADASADERAAPDAAAADDGEAVVDDEPAPSASGEPAPATTTYAWSDEGAECEACGEVVDRRWQQDGGLVCRACKDWERA